MVEGIRNRPSALAASASAARALRAALAGSTARAKRAFAMV
jgi:hypothetical protein